MFDFDDGSIRHDSEYNEFWIEPDPKVPPLRETTPSPVLGYNVIDADNDALIYDARRRFQGWRVYPQFPENHAIVSILIQEHQQGSSLCRSFCYDLNTWMPEQPALPYCPVCQRIVARLFNT